jgi:hypothetical protein
MIPTFKRYVKIFYYRQNLIQLKFCINLSLLINFLHVPHITHVNALTVFDGVCVVMQHAAPSDLLLRNRNNRLLGDEK